MVVYSTDLALSANFKKTVEPISAGIRSVCFFHNILSASPSTTGLDATVEIYMLQRFTSDVAPFQAAELTPNQSVPACVQFWILCLVRSFRKAVHGLSRSTEDISLNNPLRSPSVGLPLSSTDIYSPVLLRGPYGEERTVIFRKGPCKARETYRNTIKPRGVVELPNCGSAPLRLQGRTFRFVVVVVVFRIVTSLYFAWRYQIKRLQRLLIFQMSLRIQTSI